MRANKRFFSTLSAFIDKSRYLKQYPHGDENLWERYCEQVTNQLLYDLKKLGLEYQKITGIWAGEIENSFLVWNTNYTFEQFRDLMLKLNENYKQWGICIGRWDIDKNEYSIDLWETDSLDNIKYSLPNIKMDIKLFGGLLCVRAIRCCRCRSCNIYGFLAVCP